MSKDKQPGARKNLANMMNLYEHGDPALKAARGFYLRKMFKAFNTGVVYAEHGREN